LKPVVVVERAEATDAFNTLAPRSAAPAHGSSPKRAFQMTFCIPRV
jgi:hypothetical protein